MRLKPGQETTKKEAVFVKEFVKRTGKGMNTGKAARDAAAVAFKDTHAVRDVYVYRVLGRDRVQRYITKMLDKAGFTDENIMRDLRRIVTKGLESDKATLADATRGIDMVLRLKNRYPAHRVESKSLRLNADLMQKSRRQLRREQEKLEAEEAIFDEVLSDEENDDGIDSNSNTP